MRLQGHYIGFHPITAPSEGSKNKKTAVFTLRFHINLLLRRELLIFVQVLHNGKHISRM